MNRTVIDEYVRGGPVLEQAIAGVTAEQFRATPVPGTWSIAQIVLHLLDSDLIAADRMKRIIAEENPTLVGYNESLFAAKLFYNELDPHRAAQMFALNRALMGEILRRLPDEAFSRTGMHNERGKVALGEMVQMYVGHLDHHLRFLKHKKQLLGKGG